MDFFRAQQSARRNSRLLVGWFLVAVFGIIAAVYLALVAGVRLAASDTTLVPASLWQPELFVMSAGGVGTLVLLGSLFKIWSLSRNGGVRIAEELGGRRVSRATEDPLERRLINVVDEMAIASGIAAPPVFVLDAEQGINAFAAGASIPEAVVAVTRGALEKLSRDELQGVVAHEFSHILNGDMRLNLRLIGLLNGILLLALAGRVMLRGARRSDRSAGPLIVAGIVMVILGYIGVLCGKLMKAGVSRQREYLADAAAVQFTRNPAGIAGALKKIGGHGSRIQHPMAEEASHMFFGSSAALSRLLATHPPLAQRIRRLEPAVQAVLESTPSAPPRAAAAAASAQTLSGFSATAFAESVGDPQAHHVAASHSLLAGLPAHIVSAAHQSTGARALVFALLLSPAARSHPAQLDVIGKQFGVHVREASQALAQWLAGADPLLRLPLLDLALPTLLEYPVDARDQILATADRLIEADGRMSLFEFVLRRLLHDMLAPQRKRRARVKQDTLFSDASALLSLLAHAGAPDAARASLAFDHAVQVAQLDGPWVFVRQPGFTPRELDRVLDHLAASDAGFRRGMVQAAAAAVSQDGIITASEAELLRAVCQALDCPAPPLLGSPSATAQAEPGPA